MPTILTVKLVHYIAKHFAMRRSVGNALIYNIIMYHLVQQRLLKLSLGTLIISTYANNKVAVHTFQQPTRTLACHSAKTCTSFGQYNTGHRQQKLGIKYTQVSDMKNMRE